MEKNYFKIKYKKVLAVTNRIKEIWGFAITVPTNQWLSNAKMRINKKNWFLY